MRDQILVIGGSGFLGSHVADELEKAGFEITIYDLKDSPYRSDSQKFIQGSLEDQELLIESIKGKKFVYHFAGIADIGEAADNPLLTLQSNIMGTSYIADACVKCGVDRLLYASTVYVYSNKGSFYRASKQAAESIIETYNEKYNLDFTILRYGSLYGPRAQNWNGLKKYIIQAVNDKSIKHSGSGKEKREYIHVIDAAKLSVKAIDNNYKNESLTLTGTQVLTSSELLDMIEEIMGEEVEKTFLNKQGSFDHYTLTPYRYSPKPGVKLVSQDFVDIGQGILSVVEECFAQKENGEL